MNLPIKLLVYVDLWKSAASKMKLFWCQEFFFGNGNGSDNEFEDNNEKSCSLSRNRVSHKIDFKAVCPRSSHADSVRVKRVNSLT